MNRQYRRHPTHFLLPIMYPSKKEKNSEDKKKVNAKPKGFIIKVKKMK